MTVQNDIRCTRATGNTPIPSPWPSHAQILHTRTTFFLQQEEDPGGTPSVKLSSCCPQTRALRKGEDTPDIEMPNLQCSY
ncbi:hypothetical protein BDQ94DRAFT_155704 [Aspergillus welwitschiae]|uniref:Uncharacterized protein n=1 Tax=Aspergillus welwitschiae TaxID=1341132 RepID=A0A3F3PJ09_9EURO|nr:hypothetical protein BDQ94DRAFT_155704 [Aspergillus welwitschiae]RDH26336.1 hypothetical protein BDQ94DRAFT_155704 [Aspergillus welwitschiae]